MDSSNLLTQCEFSLQIINNLKAMIAVIDRQEMELVGANQTLFSFLTKKTSLISNTLMHAFVRALNLQRKQII